MYEDDMNSQDKAIKISLLKDLKEKVQKERAELCEEEKQIDIELSKLMPNAISKLNGRTRADFLRDDAIALKNERDLLANKSPLHYFWSEDQKTRIINIANELGPSETAKLIGVHENNIFRWRREGVVRKIGSGRKVTHPLLEKDLVKYIEDCRSKGTGLSSKRFIIYAKKLAKERNLTGITFSRGWLTKFRRRNMISIRKRNTGFYKPNVFIQEKID